MENIQFGSAIRSQTAKSDLLDLSNIPKTIDSKNPEIITKKKVNSYKLNEINEKTDLYELNKAIYEKISKYYSMGYYDKTLYDIIDDESYKLIHDEIIVRYMIENDDELDIPYEYDICADDYHEVMKYRTRQCYNDLITIYGPDFALSISNLEPRFLESFLAYYIKKYSKQFYEKQNRHVKWSELYPAYDESIIDPATMTESYIVRNYSQELRQIQKQRGSNIDWNTTLFIFIKYFVFCLVVVGLVCALYYVCKKMIGVKQSKPVDV